MTYTERETRSIRQMMRGILGRKVEGPDGVIYGFLNEGDQTEDVDSGTRLERVTRLDIPTCDLGTIVKGTVLVIEARQFKVWDRPRTIDDGMLTMLYLAAVT